MCQATGDPHFTTFDGLYFHMYHVGDYIMMATHSEKTEVGREYSITQLKNR